MFQFRFWVHVLCIMMLITPWAFAQNLQELDRIIQEEILEEGETYMQQRPMPDSIEDITGTVRLLGEETFRPRGTEVTLSLEAAIQQGLQHNPDMRISRSQVQGSLASYDLVESDFNNKFDLNSSVQENLNRFTGIETRTLPGERTVQDFVSHRENNELFTFGPVYTREFKNGVIVEVAPNAEFENDSDAAFDAGPFSSGSNSDERFNINTSVSIPLNSRPREEIRTRLDNSKLSTIQSDFSLTQQRELIEQLVTDQYWNIKQLEEQLDIQNERILQARRVEFIIRTQYEFENASEVEVGQAQVDVLETEADMISLEGDYRSAQEQMNILLGQPIETRLNLTNELTLQPLPLVPAEYVELVTSTNLQLKNLQLSIRQTENDLRVARLGQQPNLTLSADFTRDDEGFENLLGAISFNWPFGDGGATKARVRALEEQLNQQQINLWDLERDLIQETYNDLRELQLQEQRIVILRRNVEQSAINLENDLFRFAETGQISFRDMQDSQIELAQNRFSLTGALVSYNRARANLLQKVQDFQPTTRVEPILGLLDPGYSRDTSLW